MIDLHDLKIQIWALLISLSTGIAQTIELIPDNIGKLTALAAFIGALYIIRVNKKSGDKLALEIEIKKEEVRTLMLINEELARKNELDTNIK